jgi:hypothetical protein
MSSSLSRGCVGYGSPTRGVARISCAMIVFLAAGLVLAGCGGTDRKSTTDGSTLPTGVAPTNSLPRGTFVAAGSIEAIGGGGTSTLLKDGRVFIDDLPNRQGGLFDPVTESVLRTGASAGLSGAIDAQWSAVLPDGHVLLLGQTLEVGSVEIAVIYDPVGDQFSVAGSDPGARDEAAIVMLADGRVLIAGGISTSSGAALLASAQIYDPATARFAPTGSMATPRASASAALLADGRVLITGGYDHGYEGYEDGSILASAEIYDPATGKFTQTGSMTSPRTNHHSVVLPDGRVLVLGGSESRFTDLASAETYDAATGRFTATGSMGVTRVYASVTLLANGKVLVAGGSKFGSYHTSAELYDPSTMVASSS